MQGVDTPEQMGTVLHDVITEQRKILSTVRGRPAGQSPQVFTAYKEVLPAYDTGRVHLPPDITINWPDDDFGYIRRLSNPEERKRTGGSGVYYHDTFWGPPMSYLWLQTTHPALMFARDCQRIAGARRHRPAFSDSGSASAGIDTAAARTWVALRLIHETDQVQGCPAVEELSCSL